jgi:hypothetical protein
MPESQKSTNGPFENFGRKFDEHLGNIGPRVEEEVKRVIAYLNDEVVPQVRRNSSEALHAAADQLNRLAEHLDRGRQSRDRQQPDRQQPDRQGEP